jgi:hypothetical protein
LALRAADSCSPWTINLDSDLLILHVEFGVTDRPWRGQARNALVEFVVLHLAFLSPAIVPSPTEMPDGPFSIITRPEPG